MIALNTGVGHMRLGIGIFGVLVCLASVILLGLDLSRYIGGGLMDGRMHMTRILELMHIWTPETWLKTVNFINIEPNGPVASRLLDYAVSIPATIVGLLLGGLLVVFGFRIRRYRY